jgi:hypothetical protein
VAELTVKLNRAEIPEDSLQKIPLSLVHIEFSKEDPAKNALEDGL